MKLRSLFAFALGVAVALAALDAAADDLVMYLSFEGDSGNTALDSSGFGNDATFFGNPQWIDGVHNGQGMGFDGATWGEVPDDASLDLTDTLTMSAWALVNPGGEGTQSAMEKGDAWKEGEYNLAALYGGGAPPPPAGPPAAGAGPTHPGGPAQPPEAPPPAGAHRGGD